MTNEKYYSVREVCEILGKSNRTIYAYIRGGLLKASRPGGENCNYSIAESDLKTFMENGVPSGYYQSIYPRPHKERPKHYKPRAKKANKDNKNNNS